MRKKLLFGFLIGGALLATKSNAQISNSDAFGFELTSVEYGGGTSDVVTAWTQVAGFTQSSAVARTGTYSMLADFSTTIPTATPKLQTWRSNTNKEGNFDFDSDPAPHTNYTIIGYVYVDVATDGVFKVTSQKSGGQFEQATIDLSTVTPGTWKMFSKSFDFENADGSAYWSSVSFGALPTIKAKIYIDDVSFVETSTLSTATSKIEGASVDTSNGNITVVGANLDAVYSVSGQEVKATDLSSGIYIVKISKGNKQDTIKVVM